ncbi:MAG: amidase, partial [Saprospiraceae bacterium]
NYHAGIAAVARFPCLTLPMGYKENNEPQGLTLIAWPYQEAKLLKVAYQIEKLGSFRKLPEMYK